LQAGGAATNSSIVITWQPSTAALATGYEVQRCAGSNSACQGASAAWTSVAGGVAGRANHQLVDSGLARRASYSYRVRAVNSAVPTLVSPWSGLYSSRTQ
jgi:hypothetical protein